MSAGQRDHQDRTRPLGLLSDEELTVPVLPMRADEFRCVRCFLVHHRSQLSGRRDGQEVCRECS
jgi:hypothetical protein